MSAPDRPAFDDWLSEPFTLSATYVLGLVPSAERLGLDIDTLLAQAGLSLQQLRHPGSRIAFNRAFQLLEGAIAMASDPLLTLRLGAAVQARSYPVLGYAAMSCATLGDAIERLRRYEELVWNLGRSEMIPVGDQVQLQWIASGDLPLPAAVVELAISGWIHLGRQWAGEARGLQRVCFVHEARAERERYQQLLGVPVDFGCAWNGVVLDAGVLQEPLLHADPNLRTLMDAQAQRQLKDYRLQLNLSGEVRAAICQSLQAGEPELNGIASQLQLSGKLLSRRLSEQGTSFAMLLDEVRRDLALSYLQQNYGLVDIAFLLGFSEQSAFSRAFKRWTGCSPGSYREQLRSNSQS